MGNIRQTVKIEDLTKECLRTGDRDIVTFSFKYNNEIVKVG